MPARLAQIEQSGIGPPAGGCGPLPVAGDAEPAPGDLDPLPDELRAGRIVEVTAPAWQGLLVAEALDRVDPFDAARRVAPEVDREALADLAPPRSLPVDHPHRAIEAVGVDHPRAIGGEHRLGVVRHLRQQSALAAPIVAVEADQAQLRALRQGVGVGAGILDPDDAGVGTGEGAEGVRGAGGIGGAAADRREQSDAGPEGPRHEARHGSTSIDCQPSKLSLKAAALKSQITQRLPRSRSG